MKAETSTPSVGPMAVYLHCFHVLGASTGEQRFEDTDEAKAKAQAVEFASALFDGSSPIVMWQSGRIHDFSSRS